MLTLSLSKKKKKLKPYHLIISSYLSVSLHFSLTSTCRGLPVMSHIVP